MLDQVGYKYPGGERWALRNVSFRITPGERLAFVGENGAGKTTLAKLLARLYEPSEGRILLDGVDLRDYDLASLRKSIGVIFQDFVEYDLRFGENIGVGEIELVKGYINSQEWQSGSTERDCGCGRTIAGCFFFESFTSRIQTDARVSL